MYHKYHDEQGVIIAVETFSGAPPKIEHGIIGGARRS